MPHRIARYLLAGLLGLLTGGAPAAPDAPPLSIDLSHELWTGDLDA